MGFLEEEIARSERRIAKIRANPDKTKLASNLLRYELELDRRSVQLRAQQSGKPIVGCASHFAGLFRAMGFQPIELGGMTDRTKEGAHFAARVRELGLPENLCERTTLYIPMIVDGVIPRPSLVCGIGCEVGRLGLVAMCSLTGIPYFHLDVHFREPTEEALQDVMEQMHELISFTESKFPGTKFNEDELVEIEKWDAPFYAYFHDIYEARKTIPCPESIQDVLRIPPFPVNYPEPQKVVEYARIRRDEILERVKKGTGAIAHEKLRFLWTDSSFVHPDVTGFLHEKGVSVPFFLHGHSPRAFGAAYGVWGDESEYGRKLTPLEEVARWAIGSSWGGLATRWIKDVCSISRDLKIDGVVNLREPGCVPTAGFQKLVDDAVEREMGIPSLNLEGRISSSVEPTALGEIRGKLETFIDVCLQRKGIC